MERRSISIDEKIERAKECVFKCKDKYDKALEELVALQDQKIELQKQELLDIMMSSKKSYDEIMGFLSAK